MVDIYDPAKGRLDRLHSRIPDLGHSPTTPRGLGFNPQDKPQGSRRNSLQGSRSLSRLSLDGQSATRIRHEPAIGPNELARSWQDSLRSSGPEPLISSVPQGSKLAKTKSLPFLQLKESKEQLEQMRESFRDSMPVPGGRAARESPSYYHRGPPSSPRRGLSHEDSLSQLGIAKAGQRQTPGPAQPAAPGSLSHSWSPRFGPPQTTIRSLGPGRDRTLDSQSSQSTSIEAPVRHVSPRTELQEPHMQVQRATRSRSRGRASGGRSRVRSTSRNRFTSSNSTRSGHTQGSFTTVAYHVVGEDDPDHPQLVRVRRYTNNVPEITLSDFRDTVQCRGDFLYSFQVPFGDDFAWLELVGNTEVLPEQNGTVIAKLIRIEPNDSEYPASESDTIGNGDKETPGSVQQQRVRENSLTNHDLGIKALDRPGGTESIVSRRNANESDLKAEVIASVSESEEQDEY